MDLSCELTSRGLASGTIADCCARHVFEPGWQYHSLPIGFQFLECSCKTDTEG